MHWGSKGSRRVRRSRNAHRPRFEILEQRLTLSTYYVSPTGNDDSPGTQQAPWQTLQHAADGVVAGDTVDVEAGDYAGFVMGWNFPQNGTASAPITWDAQSGVDISSSNSETADGIDLESCSYIVVNGFNVTNSDGSISRAGIRAAGVSEGDVIEDNNVNDCGTWGIFTAFASDAMILNNVASNSQTQHGIYVSNTSSNDVVMGNTVFGNNDCGIQFNGDASQGGTGIITGALIEDNVIYDNGAGGGSAINCDGVQDSRIVNNLLYDNQSSGISLFQIDGGGPSINNIVVNNTIVNAADSRWDLNIQNGSTGNAAFNNVLYNDSSSDGSINVSSDSLAGFTSDYNVVVNGFTTDGGNTVVTLAQWQSATGQDEHSIVATPSQLFVNPSANDYQELPTSPSIGAGTSTDAPSTDILGNPRPSTNGYDIGCYEYEGTVSTNPPAVSSENPAPNATNVAVSTAVTATFNEAVQAGTITFTLAASSGGLVRASVSYDSSTDTATLTPAAALAYNTTYTATVSGAENLSGVAMSAPVSWSFTTDVAPPSVTSESPASGTANVNVSRTVTATFSEAVQVSTIRFVLTDSSDNSVAASVSYNSSTLTATLTPSAPLAYNTTYIATVSGAEDSAGDPMGTPVSTSFATDDAPPSVTSGSPATGTTNVAVSTSVTATFNKAVQPNTIDFTLTDDSSGNRSVAASFSYDSSSLTATLTPSAVLTPDAMYTVTVSAAEDSAGDPMSAPVSWSFMTQVEPQSVTSESPAGEATNVAVSTTVSATFLEAALANTISFALTSSSGNSVAASVSYNNSTDTATLTPAAPLAFNTTYTATVSGAENLSGVAMSAPVSWSFTTDVAPPSVTNESPASGAAKVSVSTTVTATFSKAMQAGTISFRLTDSSGNSVAANVSYNSSTDTATLTPRAPLAYDTTYTVIISGAEDSAGDPMSAPVSSTFSTQTVPPAAVSEESPASGAANVAVSTTVAVTFNEAIQADTISLVLTGPDNASVAGTVSYSSATDAATFTPSSLLAYSTTYTVTLSGAESQAGTTMAGPVTWSFTTNPVPTVPPVTITRVLEVLGKQHLDKSVLIIFSGPVNAGEAQKRGIYRLTIAGKRGSFTARNARVIPLRLAVYNVADDTVTLTPKKPFSLATAVQLVVRGEPPSGLKDSLGRFIDGGTNAVTILPRGGGATVSAIA